jgi:SAM-dependent methyltransferase
VIDHRRSYDAVAERYASEIGSELDGKPLDRSLLDTVAELASQGPVGDIGCGPGQVAAYVSKRGVSTIGVDLSPGMCRVALEQADLPAAAGDMGALPLASSSLGAIVCLYAVIHLDALQRQAAYSEFGRVLRPGGHALVAFHVSDEDFTAGGAKRMTEWWGQEVDVVFRYLDPVAELEAMTRAGLEFVARLDRQPYADVEHPSNRSYLLVRRPR